MEKFNINDFDKAKLEKLELNENGELNDKFYNVYQIYGAFLFKYLDRALFLQKYDLKIRCSGLNINPIEDTTNISKQSSSAPSTNLLREVLISFVKSLASFLSFDGNNVINNSFALSKLTSKKNPIINPTRNEPIPDINDLVILTILVGKSFVKSLPNSVTLENIFDLIPFISTPSKLNLSKKPSIQFFILSKIVGIVFANSFTSSISIGINV